MLDTLTFAELDALEMELLPPRTVLSLIDPIPMGTNCNKATAPCGNTVSTGGTTTGGTTTTTTSSCSNTGLQVLTCFGELL